MLIVTGVGMYYSVDIGFSFDDNSDRRLDVIFFR